jgi:hypothetical protein
MKPRIAGCLTMKHTSFTKRRTADLNHQMMLFCLEPLALRLCGFAALRLCGFAALRLCATNI